MNEVVRTGTGVGLPRAIVEQGADRLGVVKHDVKESILSVLLLVDAVQFRPLDFEHAESIEIRMNVSFGGEPRHAADEYFLRK